MKQFYRSVIESMVCFGITICFGGMTSGEKNELERLVRHASRIVGRDLPSAWLHFVASGCARDRAKSLMTHHTQPTICSTSSLPAGVTEPLRLGLVVSDLASSQKQFLLCSLCKCCCRVCVNSLSICYQPHQDTVPCSLHLVKKVIIVFNFYFYCYSWLICQSLRLQKRS